MTKRLVQKHLVLSSILIGLYAKAIPTIDAAFASGCACPGDILTYECTIMGYGSTIWNRRAFDCPLINNEIILFHSRFSSSEIHGSCNNGTTVARSFSIEGNNSTSQLNVTVIPDIAGKMITCLHDNYYNESIQFSIVIPTIGLSLCWSVA